MIDNVVNISNEEELWENELIWRYLHFVLNKYTDKYNEWKEYS